MCIRDSPLADGNITAGVYGQLEGWLADGPDQWTYLNSFPARRQVRATA